jgi:hypothetical protein
MTTPARPRPGTAITLHGFYTHADTAENIVLYARRCTVISFGPKQGAFYDVDMGSNVKSQIYASEYKNVSDGHGTNAAVIARIVADQVAWFDQLIAFCEVNPGARVPSYVEKCRAARAALLAGQYRVEDYTTLRAETLARFAAARG